jgi:ribonuclease HI
MDLIINTDGASRGNPGPASYGFVIRKRGGEILHQEGKTIGVDTNNVAEYSAVLNGLRYVVEHYSAKAPHTIEIVTDSRLVASQLSGKFKIKNENLKKIFDLIKSMEFDLGVVSYRNVPREQNFLADRMANIALDNAAKK